MSKDNKNPFEVPADVRTAAEHGIEQARVAFDQFMNAAKTGLETAEDRTKAAHEGARDLRTSVMSFAEKNMANTFEYIHKAMTAKDPQTLVQLQIEFLRGQMEGLSQQAKALGETMTRAATDITTKK